MKQFIIIFVGGLLAALVYSLVTGVEVYKLILALIVGIGLGYFMAWIIRKIKKEMKRR